MQRWASKKLRVDSNKRCSNIHPHTQKHNYSLFLHKQMCVRCHSNSFTSRSLQRMATQKSLAPPTYPPHTAKTPSPGTRDVQSQFILDRWVWGIINFFSVNMDIVIRIQSILVCVGVFIFRKCVRETIFL